MRVLSEIINRYRDQCEIEIYSISINKPKKILRTKQFWFRVSPWKGFFLYNFWLLYVLPQIHRNISKKINWSKYDLIFVTHDYFTKSPYIIRNIPNSKKLIYLCQEAQREFYEPSRYHSPFFKDKIANFLRYSIKLIDEKNVRHVNIIICNSKYSKEVLEKIYKKKCETVYPGVDTFLFQRGRNDKTNTILCVGGINTVKGQEFIIKSLQPLLLKYKLLLVGDGRKEDISRILKITEKSQVEILNNINDKTLVNLYRTSKVTCIAAYKEPFGLSSIESQACGTPVVSVNEGGTIETIISGVTGYLSLRSKNDFLRKVKMAIKNNKKLGANGVKNVQRYWTWDITLKPLDKYFLK